MEDNRFTIQKHVAITAGAGSGKTYTLSRRYINALLGFDLFTMSRTPKLPSTIDEAKKHSARPVEIVTTTFTEAGAMEMRSRIEKLILEVIEFLDDVAINKDLGIEDVEALKNPEWTEYIKTTLQDALYSIHLAIISTIHKFALSIIKKNVELIPMDTTIDVVDDNTKQEMFEKIWFEVINSNQKVYLEIDKKYSVYNLKEFAKRYTFDSRIRDGFDIFIKEIDELDDLKEIYLELFFDKNINKIIEVLNQNDNIQKRNNDFDKVLPQYFNNIFNLRGEGLVSLVGASQVATGYKQLRDLLDPLISFDDEVENEFKSIIEEMHKLLEKTREKYFEKIEDEGKLDFDRILQAGSELVSNPKSNLKEYKYFFVDEFQDTNMIQWELIKNSAKIDNENSANIFLVGDEKQSIFEFQGAEVSTFQKAIDEIKQLKGNESIVTPPMSLNYRSDKYVIDFVNYSFKNIMIKDAEYPKKPNLQSKTLQDFIDRVYKNYLQDSSSDHEVNYQPLKVNSKNNGTLKILVKETPKLDESTLKNDDKAKLKYNADAIALHEANMIAYFINEIKTGNYSEYNDIKEKIKNNEQAIAILCDSKKHMLMFKDALKSYSIESKVSASEDFYSAKEVIDIFYTLAMIKYLKDDQDLSVISGQENSVNQQKRFFLTGALRSNILRYNDKEIKEIIQNNSLPKEILDLVSLYNVLGVSELIDHIVQKYEVKRVYAHFDDYAQKKANINKLLDMAYRFIPVYKSALEEFVEMLQERILDSSNADEDQAFYESKQTKAIEIRTMHSSKGLAWPMVIVPELGGSLKGASNTLNYASFESKIDNQANKSRMDLIGFKVDRKPNLSNKIAKLISEEKKYAEKKRLLYVAMTRPENHLILSVAKKSKDQIEANSYWGRWLKHIDISKPKDIKIKEIKDNKYLDSNVSHTNKLKIEDGTLEYSVENYDFTLNSGECEVVVDEQDSKMNEKILPIKDIDLAISKEVIDQDIKIIDPFTKNKATDFGTLAHEVLEHGYKDRVFDTDQESEYIENFIKNKNVDDPDRLKKVIENFKSSVIYTEIKSSKEVKFEQEFNYFDKEKNDVQKRIIDLLYFYDGKWNIIDFKSNALNREKEEIIKEHCYDEQLGWYYDYVASCYSKDSVNRCEILWLDDGSLSGNLGGSK